MIIRLVSPLVLTGGLSLGCHAAPVSTYDGTVPVHVEIVLPTLDGGQLGLEVRLWDDPPVARGSG